MKKIIFTIFTLLSIVQLNAQVADIQSGCIPLEINFTGPTQSSYFWNFDDGGFSDQMNPAHIFDDAGEYTVELFDQEGGTKIGETVIVVYAKIQFAISADEQAGCNPFQVQFTNESIVDPEMNITGYLWDFGDGSNSTQENPLYTYTDDGTFSVTLTIQSDEEGCTENMTFTDFIQVSPAISAGFSLDQTVACEAPATFIISNNTQDASGYTYLWNFGNGDTSDEFNPPNPTYTEEGIYTINLTIDSGDGCVVNISRTVTIGEPIINLNVQDTFCIGILTQITNTSTGNNYSWNFGNGASPQSSTETNPLVTYNTPGPKIVTFSAIASSTCSSDTFFTIFVEDPSAAFSIDPLVLCTDPAMYTFNHPNNNFAEYEYYVRELDDLFLGTANQSYTYDEPTRDSFYISRSDTFNVILNITTQAGCKAEDSTYFVHRAPQAHFIPNVSRGCAPLTVNFDEDSASNEPITSWTWIFGDGDEVTVNSPDDMVHTYNDPGEYYVKIAIENDQGCRDTSAGIFIYVGEPLTADYTVDKTEICLYETIILDTDNLDPRIDAYHFDTDDGRISDCYKNPGDSHQFVHSPGTYPVTLTLEYNGCFNELDNGTQVTVNGSKSRIRYMTNCVDPLTVMLQDSSINATTSIWHINGDTISMDTIPGDTFNYTFDSTGNYQIFLITDDDTACNPDTSIVDLFIRQITAEFELPEFVCANATIEIDASLSQDVDNSCSEGYTWFGVANRPRTLDIPGVIAAYNPGPFSVRLITQDVNGCKDTLDKESEALDITADFTPDVPVICYPNTLSFTDLSVSDTTIVNWNWSFGSNQQNPTNLFAEGPSDTLPIQLIVENELGCLDTARFSIPVYAPTSDIQFDPSNIVCLGETINFTATDFTERGSFLNFLWTFGSQGSSTEQNPSFEVTQPGITTISLIIEEDSTGCNDEYLLNIQGIIPPVAEIGIDELDYCLSENTIIFDNNSTIDGPGDNLWNFGNGQIISTGTNPLEDGYNPSSTFPIGTYDVVLTASSIYGCSDSDMVTVNISAPQGNFTTDKTDFCANDEVLFTMIDTSDVASFTWDFGDGTTIIDQNPVNHTFGFYPPGGMYDVVLKLVSETGCQTSITIPVSAFTVFLDISPDFACLGEVMFETSVQNQEVDLSYNWNFGNGITSTDAEPIITFENADTLEINLVVEDAVSGCMNSFVDTIVIAPLPSVLDSIVCEGDTAIYYEIDFIDTFEYTIYPDITDSGFLESGSIELDLDDGLEYLVTVINEFGCAIEIPITVEEQVDIDIPNLFSPNGDMHNDFFDVIVVEKFRPLVNPITFKVYNRWGNLMYDNENPDVGWDGTLSNGDPAPAEIYTYVIQLEGNPEIFKGTVTLIK